MPNAWYMLTDSTDSRTSPQLYDSVILSET